MTVTNSQVILYIPVKLGCQSRHEGNDQEGLHIRALHQQHAKGEELHNDQTHADTAEQERPHHPSALVLPLIHVSQVVAPSHPGKHEPHHAERHQQGSHHAESQGDEVHHEDMTHLKAIARGARTIS